MSKQWIEHDGGPEGEGMNRAQMQAVVDRLWALCDGAEPAVDEDGNQAPGICYDILVSCDVDVDEVLGEYIGKCCGFITAYAFYGDDWGNNRRCLAGVLAGYIEGLMDGMQE